MDPALSFERLFLRCLIVCFLLGIMQPLFAQDTPTLEDWQIRMDALQDAYENPSYESHQRIEELIDEVILLPNLVKHGGDEGFRAFLVHDLLKWPRSHVQAFRKDITHGLLKRMYLRKGKLNPMNFRNLFVLMHAVAGAQGVMQDNELIRARIDAPVSFIVFSNVPFFAQHTHEVEAEKIFVDVMSHLDQRASVFMLKKLAALFRHVEIDPKYPEVSKAVEYLLILDRSVNTLWNQIPPNMFSLVRTGYLLPEPHKETYEAYRKLMAEEVPIVLRAIHYVAHKVPNAINVDDPELMTEIRDTFDTIFMARSDWRNGVLVALEQDAYWGNWKKRSRKSLKILLTEKINQFGAKKHFKGLLKELNRSSRSWAHRWVQGGLKWIRQRLHGSSCRG